MLSVETRATERTRLVDELGKIAFSDIGKVVTWGREVTVIPATENGEAVKTIVSRVTVVDSAEIDDDTRAAVAEVSQDANGALRIEMHDKIAAIDKLARALGMYTKKLDVNPNADPVVAVTIYEGRPATWPAPGETAAEAGLVSQRPASEASGAAFATTEAEVVVFAIMPTSLRP
jgi:hypothetical protein